MEQGSIAIANPAKPVGRPSPQTDGIAASGVDPRFRRWFWLGALVVALPALVVYALTLEPSVYFVDSGGFLATIKVFGIDYAPGFPLYILLATAWTHLIGLVPGLMTFTQRVNYFSGLAATVMAVAIYAATFELLTVEGVRLEAHPLSGSRPHLLAAKSAAQKGHRGSRSLKAQRVETQPLERRRSAPLTFQRAGNDRRWLALAAATFAGWLTAFAYTVWSQAITAAPYTFEGMFSAIVLYLAIRLWRAEPITRQPTPAQRRLILEIAAAYGCAWAVHYLALGLVPFFLLLIYRYRIFLRNPRLVWLGIGTFLLCGVLPYAYEPIRSAAWPVVDWGHAANLHNLVVQLTGATWTTHSSNFRIFQPIKLLPAIGHWTTLTFYQFLPITLVLTVAGWWFIWRRYRSLFVPFLVFYAGSVAVALTYVTNNDESYLIPAHIVLPVTTAVGLVGGIEAAGGILKRRGDSRFNGRPAVTIASGVAVLLVAGTVAASYPDLDRHNNYVVEDYAKNALRDVPPHGVMLVPGDELNEAILYLQVVLHERTDVAAIPASVASFDWWRESFRRHHPRFTLPEIPLTNVSSEPEWLGELAAGLIAGNPGRTLYVMTLANWRVPTGYTPVPAGIGYRLVAKSDTAALKIRRDNWDFPAPTLDEVLGRPHFLQAAYNVFLHEIQLAYMQAFQNLGDRDFMAGRYVHATEDYTTGLRFVPTQPELRLGEGASLAKAGHVQVALNYLSAPERPAAPTAGTPDAARITAAFGPAFNAIGNQLYRQNNLPRAFEDYRLAYLLAPTDPGIIANWGAAMAMQNDPNQALTVLRRGIRIAPRSAKLYFNLGQVYESLGNLPRSDQMFSKAFALDPSLRSLLKK